MAKLRQVAGVVGGTLLAVSACGGSSTTSSNSPGGAPPGLTAPGAGSGGSAPAGAAPMGGAGQAGGGGTVVGGTAPAVGNEGAAAPEGGAATDGGASGQANAAGEGGEGGAPTCPEIECVTSCAGRWLGVDGCSTCACAPPSPELTHETSSCPGASLTMTAASSSFIGGIDRWLISLEWKCAAASLGGPARASLEIGLVRPLSPPLDSTNQTLYWSAAQPLRGYEVRAAKIWRQGSGVPEIEVPLLVTSSFLSIRREGDELVGGVQYLGADSSNAHRSTLAGPFRVPVPTP